MNGVHDMGGMHGLGPLEIERDEPLFHAPWEARALAVTLAMGGFGKWTLDASRHARELIPGPEYLRMSYYERWIAGLESLMQQHGLVTAEELASGRPDPAAPRRQPAVTAAEVPEVLRRGGPTTREVAVEPGFRVGQAVRTRNIHPEGHTRLPRYARGKTGVVARDHGVHVFADANAHGRGEQPQHLYSVRFTGRELWGEAAAARDSVYIDLWESHLEPA